MFKKWIERAFVNGEEKEIEVRKDEMFGRRCRIIGKVGLEIDKQEEFNEIIEKPCIFCMPEKLAKFDDDKMLENEYAFLFPNIHPYAEYSAVCAFKKHYIKPEEFSAHMLEKNLLLCFEYVRKIKNNIKYASINWNYMMPAGASILHPHTQVVVSMQPTTYMEGLIGKREDFMEYVTKEKSERFIGEIGDFTLFTPFVPFGFNEVVGIAKKEFFEVNVHDLAQALQRIISYYAKIKRNSFNVAIFASLRNEFPLHFRIITRQNMVKYYRNDAMFFERLHLEVILEKKPEEICKEIKEYINSSSSKE